MERVAELLDQLRLQHQQQASPEKMLATVQQLQDVLSAMVRSAAVGASAGKVAVVLPPKRRPATVAVSAPAPQPPVVAVPEPTPTPIAALPAATTEIQTTFPEPENPAPAPEKRNEALEIPGPPTNGTTEGDGGSRPYTLQKPPATEYIPSLPPALPDPPAAPPQTAVSEPVQEPEREVYHLHFDTADEAPTLTQQQFGATPKELHEVISGKAESLNDRLKQDKPELAHKLKEAPIKDLRKAIGINDKFLFIRELFRGDEAMYERSIKTINNFHILAEAEYWISRELKVKLGWDDRSEPAQAFYHLVRRRFG